METQARRPGIGGVNDGFTHCFTLTFARVDDRDDNLGHPAHQAYVGILGTAPARSPVIDYWATPA